MKFECKGEVFIKAVQQVSRARSKTQSQQSLQDIHLEVTNHLLTLRATNLELFCEKVFLLKESLTVLVFARRNVTENYFHL